MAPGSVRPSGRRVRAPKRYSIPPLNLPRDRSFPFRQEVRIPIGDWKDMVPILGANFARLGYQVVTPSQPLDGSYGPSTGNAPPAMVSERNCHPTRMLGPMKLSIYTVFGAAFTLGAFDTIAVGTPLVIFPWVAGAAGIAGAFWYWFGRSFESDVVVVSWKVGRAPGDAPGGSGSTVPSLLWWGGRVRSDVRGRTRISVRIEAIPWLAGDLGAAVRAFNVRLEAAQSN